jgi:short-subunit dehydrogenase
MTRIRDANVLVTGGAAGLGRLFAEKCLEEGARGVVLWDIDTENLELATRELRDHGHTVDSDIVDVANPEAIGRAAAAVLDRSGPPDVLCNNAGVVVGKPFQDHEAAEIERTIRINVLGVMHVARAFLPEMIRRGSGHVVNVASAAGYLPNPNMSVYVASKWAVLGWSESLRLELERSAGGLRVTTVTPSYIDTGMFEGVKAPLLTPILAPDRLVSDMIRAVKADRILLRAPFMVRLLPLFRGILPTRVFDLLVGRVCGVYDSMDSFVGRASPH